jgi:tetratricopeptide (TPR) repeat protein
MTYINESNMSNEAIDVYEKVYMKNPGDKTVRRLLCEAYIRANNRNDGAIRVYESQLQDEPNRVEIRTILISAYMSKQKYEKVIEHCMVVFESGVFDTYVLTSMKNAYEKLGKIDELQKIYEELYVKFPQEQQLKEYMNRVKTQADVARLTSGKTSSGGVNPKICANCAHINPPTSTKCEKCSNPL